MAVGLSLAFAASANAAGIVVETNLDSGGDCTLRQAITAADTDAIAGGCSAGDGNDTIEFAAGVAGEIAIGGNGALVITSAMGDVEIEGPGAAQLAVDGGGINGVFETNGDVEISGLTIRDGRSNQGAGISNQGNLHLDRVTVIANIAVAQDMTPASNTFAVARGGGILSLGAFAALAVTESYIADNSAGATTSGTMTNTANAFGGGIYAGTGTDLHVRRSAFSGNAVSASATGGTANFGTAYGGAVSGTFLDPSSIELSTFWTNSASTIPNAGQEAGASVHGDSSLTLTSNTVTGGDASAAGGNLFGASAMPIQNTIVAEKGDPSSTNCIGVLSLGHNLSDDPTCGGTPDDILSTEPNLLPPANYGGPTQTRPPAPPDPPIAVGVIDGGISAGHSEDARGLPRTWDFDAPNLGLGDGTDIGAVEIQGPTPLGTNPGSPGDEDQPRIFGSVEPGSSVQLSNGIACAGPLDTELAATFASPGIESTPVAPDTVTTYRTLSFYGVLTSECSDSIDYTRRPIAPVLSTTDPVSGGDDNNPAIKGTAASPGTVNLYTSASCTGPVAGSGTTAELVDPGIDLDTGVADNSTTNFYASVAGTNATSSCSGPISYTEVTPAPPTPPATTPPTTTPPATTRKKCKKGRKLKRGKCVKKKKRKK